MMGIATWVFCMQRKLPLLSGVAVPLIMTADVVSLASFLNSSLGAPFAGSGIPTTLHAQVAHLLRQMLVKNRIAPGAQLNARLQALRFRSNQDEDKWHAAVQEHGQMLAALSQRDGAALAAIMQTHLVHKRDAVLALMRAGQLQQTA